MNATGRTRSDGIVPEMFSGPARLRPLVPLLRRSPFALSSSLLSALTVGDGLVRGRLGLVSQWAAAQGRTGLDRWRLAFSLLATHGRFIADEMMLGIGDVGELRRYVVVHGAEHMERAQTGALLLGFHLGPPQTSHTLRTMGYRVVAVSRGEMSRHDARWAAPLDAGIVVRMSDGTPAERTQGLNRLRHLLRDGALVYLTADGPFGREAFQIDVPGRALVVRAGWLTLRRLTGVPVLPVFAWYEGRRRVIAVHRPLPAPVQDAVSDAESCRDVLTPLVREYVAKYPEQCRYLAFPPWASTDAPYAD
jgi:lauroyl/myristoyl acyltransferase